MHRAILVEGLGLGWWVGDGPGEIVSKGGGVKPQGIGVNLSKSGVGRAGGVKQRQIQLGMERKERKGLR